MTDISTLLNHLDALTNDEAVLDSSRLLQAIVEVLDLDLARVQASQRSRAFAILDRARRRLDRPQGSINALVVTLA